MTDWNKLKVVDLRAELKARGLLQTGLKPVLVARLTEAEDGSDSEATIQADSIKIDASAATSPETNSPVLPTDPSAGSVEATSQGNAEVDSHNIETPLEPTSIDSVPSNTPALSQTLPVTQQSTSADSIHTDLPELVPQGDAHSSNLPSVEPQEAIEDRQKRKRRSETPPLSTQDAERKRARREEAEEDNRVITTAEDAAWIRSHNAVTSAAINTDALEVAQDGKGVEPGPTIIDVAREEVIIEDSLEASADNGNNDLIDDGSTRQRNPRFKGLFTAPHPSATENHDLPEMEVERDVSPAVHPATAALYIRDFMRPLHAPQLKAHLANLATPPGHQVMDDIIVDFYLDAIRTHALVSFTSISAASRVRSALHNLIWPDERNRKPLWVDFIPSEKVVDWINEEQSAKDGRRSGGSKWEVVYEADENQNIKAFLQVQDSHVPNRGPPPSFEPVSESNQTPVAPRSIEGAPTGPRISHQEPPPPLKPITDTEPLDQLFKYTTALPKLYWLPASKELVDKRLDEIEDLTSKSYDTRDRPGAAINRYTFEDGDKLVDRGVEVFGGLRPPAGFRGPTFSSGRAPQSGGRRGGGYGGGRGGGLRRGNYDSYRGGGGGGSNYRERDYDRGRY